MHNSTVISDDQCLPIDDEWRRDLLNSICGGKPANHKVGEV